MGYGLAPALSFCTADDRRIFLDTNRDLYFCLSDAADRSFSRLVDGSSLAAQDMRNLDGLVARGVLHTSEHAPSPTPCPRTVMPRRSLYEAPANSRFFPTLRALAGYLSARWKLRYCGLAASLRSLEARKSRIAARPDAQAMADAVAGDFRRAAMLATTRNYCLPHSLAVANALFTRNVPADLVLGVRTRPFGAHCWVQFHEAVVNDSIDNVRDYIPIRVI